jgi:hypothetical protein
MRYFALFRKRNLYTDVRKDAPAARIRLYQEAIVCQSSHPFAKMNTRIFRRLTSCPLLRRIIAAAAAAILQSLIIQPIVLFCLRSAPRLRLYGMSSKRSR